MSGRAVLLFHANETGKGGLLSRNPWMTLSLERIASRADSFAVPGGVSIKRVDGVKMVVI